MNAASASIRVDRLARLAGLKYEVVYGMLRRYRLLHRRRGVALVFYADLAALAPDLYQTIALLLPAVRKRGRPPVFAPRYRNKPVSRNK